MPITASEIVLRIVTDAKNAVAGTKDVKVKIDEVKRTMKELEVVSAKVSTEIAAEERKKATATKETEKAIRANIAALKEEEREANRAYSRMKRALKDYQKDLRKEERIGTPTEQFSKRTGMEMFGGIVKGAVVGRMVREIFDAVSGLYGVYRNLIESALEWNIELEKAKVGMAAMISQGFEIKANGEKITDGAQKYAISLQLAANVQKQLLVASQKNVVTFQELNEHAIAGMALMTARKVPLQQQADLLALILSAEKAIGIQQQQLFMEMKQLFRGDLVRGELARQLQALGKMTQDEMKNLSGEALVRKLASALSDLSVAGIKWQETIKGKWEVLTDNMKFALANVFNDPGLQTTVTSLIDNIMQRFFIQIKDSKGNLMTVLTQEGRELVEVIKNISTGIAKLLGLLSGGVTVSSIVYWSKLIIIFTTLTGVATTLMVAMASLVVVLNAMHIALNPLVGIVSVLTAIVGGTIALSSVIDSALTPSLHDMDTVLGTINGKTYYLHDDLAKIAEESNNTGNKISELTARYNTLVERGLKRTTKETEELRSVSQQLADLVPDAVAGYDATTGAVNLMAIQLENAASQAKNLQIELAKVAQARMVTEETKIASIESEMSRLDRLQAGDEERTKIMESTIAGLSKVSPVFREVEAVARKAGVTTEELWRGMKQMSDLYSGRHPQGRRPLQITDLVPTGSYGPKGGMDWSTMVDWGEGTGDVSRLGRFQAYLAQFKNTIQGFNDTQVQQMGIFVNSAVTQSRRIVDASASGIAAARESLQAELDKTAPMYAAAKASYESLPEELRKMIENPQATPSGSGAKPDGGKGKTPPLIDSDLVKEVKAAIQGYIDKLNELKGAYNDPVWKQFEKTFESERKILEKSRDELVAKRGAAESLGQMGKVQEYDKEIASKNAQIAALEKRRDDTLREIVTNYADIVELTTDQEQRQAVINELVRAGGEAWLEYKKALTQREGILGEKALIEKAVPHDDEQKVEKRRRLLELENELNKNMIDIAVAREKWRSAVRVESLEKEAEMVKANADIEKDRIKDISNALKDVDQEFEDWFGNWIEGINKGMQAINNNLDATDVKKRTLDERYEKGSITTKEYNEGVGAVKRDKMYMLNNALIELVQKRAGIENTIKALEAAQIPVAEDLYSTYAKLNKLIQQIAGEMESMKDEVGDMSKLLGDALGQLSQILSSFGGTGSVLGGIVQSASNLLKTVEGLKDLEIGGNKVGGIGDLFKKSFSNGFSGFMQGLPSMLGLAGGFIGLGQSIFGGISKLMTAEAERIAKEMQERFSRVMDAYSSGLINMSDTMGYLDRLKKDTADQLGGVKGGKQKMMEIMPQIDQQMAELRAEQRKIFEAMEKSLASLRLEENLRSVYQSFDDVIRKYREYINANGNVITANEYLTLSFADMRKKLVDEYTDALEDYNEDVEDEMDNWIKGAEDDWGRLISLEKKAQLDIMKAIKDFNDGMKERNDERKQLQEDLAKFIADKEKEIVDIQNEGILERRKSTQQDKLDRIAAIQDEIAEERERVNERLAELDEEDKKAKENLAMELSRINLRLAREREAHLEKMQMLDEEGRKAIENLQQQIEYMDYLIAHWQDFYQSYVNADEIAKYRELGAQWMDTLASDYARNQGRWGSVDWPNWIKVLKPLIKSVGFSDSDAAAATSTYQGFLTWMAAHPNIIIYKDLDGQYKIIDLNTLQQQASSSTSSSTTGTTTGTTGSTGTSGQTSGSAGGGSDLAEYLAAMSQGGGGGAGVMGGGMSVGQQNNVIITVNVTGVPINPDTIEEDLYTRVLDHLDQAYRQV